MARKSARRQANAAGSPAPARNMPSPQDLPPVKKQMKRVANWAAVPRELSPRSSWHPPGQRDGVRREARVGKALRRRPHLQGLPYPFLIETRRPKLRSRKPFWPAPRGGQASLQLDEPLLIYSRIDLNRMLLERAERAGRADREGARAGDRRAPAPAGGCAPTPASLDADFCIVATGARNPLRDFGTRLTAAGHHVRAGLLCSRRPGADRYSISCRSLEGYIWIFPRCGHLSVGICGKGEPAGGAAPAAGAIT